MASKKKRCIVRTEYAGVFLAEVVSMEDGQAELANARRLWYWDGAASLSQLAMDGVSKPGNCKFPAAVPEMIVRGVIEIIQATDKACKSVDGVKVWEM